ncbi:DNA primase [Microbacterium phage RikSengupta]|nr:DNA primase [Microbacterium phage Sparcetus]WMI33147.1 DNA primase [Microbacterium phage RikSengupta]
MPTTKEKKYKPETVRAAFSPYAVGPENDGEQRMFCPICENPHTSASPSASMNADTGVWNCLKNNHGGSIYHLVQDLKRERGFDIRRESMRGRHANPEYSEKVQERLGNSSTPLPGEDTIEKWATALISNKTRLKALMEQRGFERKTIIDWQLGWDGSRYTIPVRDVDGALVNVRRYQMGGGHTNKMLNLPGHGSAALFRPDILRDNERIVITEGETDCILLNQTGIPAVTHTAGASTFRTQWAGQFVDKDVWIAYDADDAGRKGAKRVQDILSAFARNVFILSIPQTTKGADVTDFIHLEGHSKREFEELMTDAMDSGGVPKMRTEIPTTGERTNLNDSMSQNNQNKTLELTVSIAGKQSEPYTAPKLITATCDQSKGAACTMCPIAARGGQAEIEIRIDDEDLFRFIDVPEQRRKTLIKEITGARCSDRVEFDIDENYHVEELLVQPSVDDRRDDETQQPVRRTAFSISSHSSTVNSKVRLVGKNVPDPKTGKLRFMSWVNEPVEMDIDKFVLTAERRHMLTKFQPDEDQSPLEKAMEIAADMSENVTHIYGRDILHVAYDLVWHSVLSFKIGDMVVDKGWIEMAVIGDTRTGKSEIGNRLIRHYRSGTLQSCEGMSFAGLVGGVQQIDGRWHMTWGVIPMNDRRMVILDEVSGLKEKDVIEQMSSVRSSGIAQVTKIASEETSARTRLAWVMNPADGSMIRDNPAGGMGAIRTVVPASEDVARFDFVLATAKGDVESKRINGGFAEHHSPEYTSEECETLIKWVWSLTRNDVVISEAAQKAVVKAAMDMGERYISDPPLIQSENVRFKLLRIAAALAARTFSANSKGKLLVKAEHIRDAVKFLDTIYSEDAMGYARASKRAIEGDRKAREKRNLVVAYLREHPDDVLLTLNMVGGSTFRTRDFVDFGGMETTQAKQVVQTLLKWNVIKLKSRGDIQMDPVLLASIREVEEENQD